MQLKDKHVSELFKEHCERCIKEDKGKNYNYLQETYANTELFDLSLLDVDWDKYKNKYQISIKEETAIIEEEFLGDISLPFEGIFLKLPNTNMDSLVSLYLHEFTPNTVTGLISFKNETCQLSAPFHILSDTGKIYIILESIIEYAKFIESDINNMSDLICNIVTYMIRNLHVAIDNLNNLPKHTVVADKVNKAEYYRRKGLPTIKVFKPIYYVMDKKEGENKNSKSYKLIKPLGKLEYTYSFKVRSHWRRIDPKSYGKNRNGEYVVKGYTFVKDYIKGEGELVKRVRVLK